MLKRALLTASIGLSLAITSYADPARTMITGSSKTKSVYENVNTSPMRTTLTRENKYPDTGQLEVGGFFEHTELGMLEQDSFGVNARAGLSEFVTIGASIPFVESDLDGDSNSGLGDIELSLDLLAYQDIFQYPFVIPHIDVSLPTGDDDEGLGSGETVTTIGLSVGTKVYDALTYVVDFAYAFDGGNVNADDDNIFMISGSLVWDVSDRLAFLVEGRVFEENMFDNVPYEAKGGMVYRFTRDVQLGLYGGTAKDETPVSDDSNDIAEVRLSVQL